MPRISGSSTVEGLLVDSSLDQPVAAPTRLTTFARGWTFVMEPDGTLHVTTPTGITRTTRPAPTPTRAATGRTGRTGPRPTAFLEDR